MRDSGWLVVVAIVCFLCVAVVVDKAKVSALVCVACLLERLVMQVPKTGVGCVLQLTQPTGTLLATPLSSPRPGCDGRLAIQSATGSGWG